MKIHSYPLRSFRNPEAGEKEWIKIICVICEIAMMDGIQYTKRLLPDFLVPYGIIRSDKVLIITEKETEQKNLDSICSELGCIDPRTAQAYLSRMDRTIRKASLTLAERLTQFSLMNPSPQFHPAASIISIFRILVSKYHAMQVHLHGGSAVFLNHPLCYYIKINWLQRDQKKPSTSVSDAPSIPDTS